MDNCLMVLSSLSARLRTSWGARPFISNSESKFGLWISLSMSATTALKQVKRISQSQDEFTGRLEWLLEGQTWGNVRNEQIVKGRIVAPRESVPDGFNRPLCDPSLSQYKFDLAVRKLY